MVIKIEFTLSYSQTVKCFPLKKVLKIIYFTWLKFLLIQKASQVFSFKT